MNIQSVFCETLNILQRGWTSALPPRLRYALTFGHNYSPMMGRLRKMRRRGERRERAKHIDTWMRLRTEERVNRQPHGWFANKLALEASSLGRPHPGDRRFTGSGLDFYEDIAAMRAHVMLAAHSQPSVA